jgi:MFS family permease
VPLYVIVARVYPEEYRPKIFAAMAGAWVVPSLVGPSIGGLVAQHAGWRWVFLGLVPFVVLGSLLLVPALRVLDRPAGDTPRDPRRILRAVAVAGGLVLVEGAGQHPSVLGAIGLAGGLAVVGWGIVPLLPKGTFRARPGVASAVAMRGLMAGAFFGVDATVPLMLTVQHGYSALESGVPLTLSGLTWAVGSWWQSRAAGDDDAHRLRLAKLGYLFIGVGAVLVAAAAPRDAAAWPVYVAWLLAGCGAGLTMPSSSVLLLRHTTDADRGADSASLQLADTTSAALTTGFAGILVAAAAAGSFGYGPAFAINDAVMLAIALLGVLTAHRAATKR